MRLTRLRQSMAAQNYPALLITEPLNIRYLCGFTGTSATLLITQAQQYLITDYRYTEQATAQCPAVDVICRDRATTSLAQCVAQLLETEQPAQLLLEYANLSVEMFLQLQQTLPCPLAPAQPLIEPLRSVKDDTELSCLRRAANIADQAFTWLVPQLQTGMTEREASDLLQQKIYALGADELAFPTILLSGARSAMPHGQPGQRRFARGDFILLDFGARVDGYRSDMTRTLILGKASAGQRHFYHTVLNAQQSALAAARAGISAHQLNQIAQQVLQQSPYAAYAGEGLGHGVGLALHEFPLMRSGCHAELIPGMVLTIEPGLYKPGFGGVRIEDDIVITESGYQLLTQSPRQLIELPA